MRKTDFNDVVNDGIVRGRQYIAVKIITEGNPAPEIIINPSENFDQKIAYYNKAYDDNMELISAKEKGKSIKIEDVLITSNLNDLSWFVY